MRARALRHRLPAGRRRLKSCRNMAATSQNHSPTQINSTASPISPSLFTPHAMCYSDHVWRVLSKNTYRRACRYPFRIWQLGLSASSTRLPKLSFIFIQFVHILSTISPLNVEQCRLHYYARRTFWIVPSLTITSILPQPLTIASDNR